MTKPTVRGGCIRFQPSVFTAREAGIVEKALNFIEERRLRGRPILNTGPDLEHYLMLRFVGLTNEQCHVLYLNINFELIAAEAEFFGRQSHVATDIRQIVLHAITLGAEHIVFAHNRPSENSRPSEDDIDHLTTYEGILRKLGINLLDSYVVTSRGITSIKSVRDHNREEELRLFHEQNERRRVERRRKIAATKASKRTMQDAVSPFNENEYRAIKGEYPAAILFYRKGDFYDLYFEDAAIVGR